MNNDMFKSTEHVHKYLSELPCPTTSLGYQRLCVNICKFSDFKDFELISEGSFGVVVKAVRKQDGKEIAMKFFGYTKTQPDPNWIDREIETMIALRGSPGVVQIEGVFLDSSEGFLPLLVKQKKFKHVYPVIMMELLKGGDLFTCIQAVLNKKEGFTERHAAEIFKLIVSAIQNFHEKGVLNRDLKAENMAIGYENNAASEAISNIKILDFGCAIPFFPDGHTYTCCTQRLGTFAYLAPEIVANCREHGDCREFKYSKASDMWQAGCILHHILYGERPFTWDTRASQDALIHKITTHAVGVAGHDTPSAAALSLLRGLLNTKPENRLTSQQALNHAWLKNTSRSRSKGMSADNPAHRRVLGKVGSAYETNIAVSQCRRELKKLLFQTVAEFKHRRVRIQALLRHQIAAANNYSASASASASASVCSSDFVVAIPCSAPVAVALDNLSFERMKDNFAIVMTENPNVGGINKDQFIEVLCQSSFLNQVNPCDHDALFEIFDEDHNGLIDSMEFLNTLSCLRLDESQSFASDFNAKIIYGLFSRTLGDEKPMDRCRFDQSMQKFLERNPEFIWRPAVAEQLFKEIDDNENGEISNEEFGAFLHVVLHESPSCGGKGRVRVVARQYSDGIADHGSQGPQCTGSVGSAFARGLRDIHEMQGHMQPSVQNSEPTVPSAEVRKRAKVADKRDGEGGSHKKNKKK